MSPLYENILQKVESLSESEQLRLISQLAERLRTHASRQMHTSILDLQGLGKDIWGGRDAQEYVDHERSTWNG